MNQGDAYYVEEYDGDDRLYSELWVIPYHDHVFANGKPDTGKNKWVNMGHMGGEGPRGEIGPEGPEGPPGDAYVDIIDSWSEVILGDYQEGKMLMERATKTIFVRVNPAIRS